MHYVMYNASSGREITSTTMKYTGYVGLNHETRNVWIY
jgi:hypothetical protein